MALDFNNGYVLGLSDREWEAQMAMAGHKAGLNGGSVVVQTVRFINKSKEFAPDGLEVLDLSLPPRAAQQRPNDRKRAALRVFRHMDGECQKFIDVLYEQIDRVQAEQTRLLVNARKLSLAPEGAINNGEEDTNG